MWQLSIKFPISIAITYNHTTVLYFTKMKDVKQQLQKLDRNNDGILTAQEVLDMFENQGTDFNFELMLLLTEFADMEGKVHIDKVVKYLQIMDEFASAAGPEEEKKVMLNFLHFIDDNGDGRISRYEAKKGFEKMKIWPDVKPIFEGLACDEGKVSINEFMAKLKESRY